MNNNNSPAYYAVIPADVRYDKRLSPNAKLMYGEITALSNKEGYCWASNSYFAELYSVTPQSASNWIQELMINGYIRMENFPEKGNLRHIYLLNRNQESFDFEAKTTIKKNHIVPEKIGELSNNFIELSKKTGEVYKKSYNHDINTINNTSSSSSRTDPPPTQNLTDEELQDWIRQRYRHWFSRVDCHPVADVDAVHKAILGNYLKDICQSDLLKIAERAFERVVQEKPKKDWLTREVLIRIKWGVEDWFRDKDKAEAAAKKEAIKKLKPGDIGIWNPKADEDLQKLLKPMFDPAPQSNAIEVPEKDLNRRRKESLFEQAVKEGR